MLSWDDRPLTLRQRLTLVDTCLCFLLFTPLQVLFWQGTWNLLDPLFDHAYPSVSALVLLCVAVGVQVGAALCQDRMLPLVSAWLDEEYLPFGKRAYNYVLATVGVWHARAVWELYVAWVGPGAVLGLRATVTVLVILATLRCTRTLLSSPLELDLDVQHTDYSWSTLFRTQAEETKEYAADALATVGVVFSLGHLYFAAFWHVLESVSPTSPLLTVLVFLTVGYTCCLDVLLVTQKAQAASRSLERTSFAARLVLEAAFSLAAALASTVVWYALWTFFDFMADRFPIYQHGRDVSAVYGHILAYVMLTMCYCSETLVQRDCPKDGELEVERGVAFTTEYFRDFFSEELRDVEEGADLEEAGHLEDELGSQSSKGSSDDILTMKNGRLKFGAQENLNRMNRSRRQSSKDDISLATLVAQKSNKRQARNDSKMKSR